MNDPRLFAFESDFFATLRCVKMAVRFKLDRAGIKLSLRQLSRFTVEDRRELSLAPCRTEAEAAVYCKSLILLIAERAGEVAKPLPSHPASSGHRSAGPYRRATLTFCAYVTAIASCRSHGVDICQSSYSVTVTHVSGA